MFRAQIQSRMQPEGFDDRFNRWKAKGLSTRAAGVLALCGCETVADVERLGRDHFVEQSNVGAKTLAELGRLAAWSAGRQTPADAIAASLALTIPNPEDCRAAATDALVGLRRAGFVITPSSPTGRRSSAGQSE